MKKVVACSLVLAAVASDAGAKSLEDVLKEKGVITEEDYKEVTKSKPTRYTLGNGKGFTFTSADEKFQLMLGGRLQARYSFFDRDEASRDPSQLQDVSEFRIRRMKMWLSGYAYTKDLNYLVQVDFTQSANAKFIDYAYLNYKFMDEVQLLAGQTKIPFGRQWLTSSSALDFVDRSPVSDAFRPGYDIGVMLSGKIANGLVNYATGGFGGVGQGTVRTTNDNAFAARVVVNPLGDMPYGEGDLETLEKPLFSVGANFFYDSLNATRTGAVTTLETNNLNFAQPRNGATLVTGGWLGRSVNFFPTSGLLRINTYGVDAAFKWLGAYAIAEYFNGEAKGANRKLRSDGYYVQAGYCIIPKTFEVAARYSFMDPNHEISNDLFFEYAGALSYYFNKHNLKLQGDVASLHDQSTHRSDEMQYRLQAQIIF